ncbi:MAG: contractile injection system protein, VgrG/Pvc8 family [Reinekea sp.]
MNHTHITLQLSNGLSLPVIELDGRESLNAPTCLSVTCPDDNPAVEVSNLTGQAATVLLHCGGYQRHWRLAIDSVRCLSNANGATLYFTLCSKLHWAHEIKRTRLFMYQNRVQVLKQLLSEAGYQGFEIDLILDLNQTPEGPFLQAQESNFSCFQRLLAEVGGVYWFEHHPDRKHETLMIRNDQVALGPYLSQVEWGRFATPGLADAPRTSCSSARPLPATGQ